MVFSQAYMHRALGLHLLPQWPRKPQMWAGTQLLPQRRKNSLAKEEKPPLTIDQVCPLSHTHVCINSHFDGVVHKGGGVICEITVDLFAAPGMVSLKVMFTPSIL